MKINNIGGIMALLSIVFLAGCSTSNTSTSIPNDSDVNLTYNDLYNVDTSKRPIKLAMVICQIAIKDITIFLMFLKTTILMN